MRTRDSNGRRLATLAVCCAIVVLVLAAVAMPVAGHAYLSDSDPANGDRLEALPETVTLEFSGDGVQVADVTVTGPDGEDVSGDAVIDPDDDRLVSVSLERDDTDADGIYTVDWEILAEDGHTTAGSFFFSVGDEPVDRESVLEAYADDEDDVSIATTAAKGALLLAVVALVGVPVTAAVAVYPVVGRFGVAPSVVDRRLTRVLAGAGVVLFGAVLALGVARSASIGSSGLSLEAIRTFAATPLGHVWLVQLLVAALVATGLLAGVRGSLDRRYWLGSSLAGAVVVQATVSWTSHSATLVDRLQGVTVDFAHVAGAGLWLGGLCVLAAVLPTVLADAEAGDRDRLAADAIRRYSIVALTGVTLALLTGLILAVWHAPTLAHLAETTYGTALSAKVLLVVAALGLGGFTRFVLLRRLDPDRERSALERRVRGRGSSGRGSDGRVRENGGREAGDDPTVDETASTTSTLVTRVLSLEVALLVLVVVLSGLLTSTPTAVVAEQTDAGDPVTLEREYDDGIVELTVGSPSVWGEHGSAFVDEGEPVVFDVTFTSASDGDPLESDRPVTILAHNERADTQLQFDLEATEEPGTYSTVQTLPDPLWWELRVSGSPEGTYVSEWVDVYAVPDGHEHVHEYAPLEETGFTYLLRIGAIVVGVAGSLAVAVETVRFGRRQR
ncbi:copper resistance CopC/CopD family protein [Natronoglomus mannanivorans]|uniref:Copper resistance protein CopC n=1 Tax=Natronoglomus mannanivorans TaxID=2979990 RepID=A0AAP3E4D1_9EURY|nr:copper resistance protein CopC [Halobacteria archaeon AArc-xg1-1]